MRFVTDSLLLSNLATATIACCFFAGPLLCVAGSQDGIVVETKTVASPELENTANEAAPKSWLRNELFPAAKKISTPALDVATLLAEDKLRDDSDAFRVGVVQRIAPVSSADKGVWTELDNGGWLWTISFSVAGAESVRLHISPFDPPAGAELFVYSPDHPDSVRGPITGSYQPFKELWTPTIYDSSEICLEYYLPPEHDPTDAGSAILVDSVVNNYRPAGGGPQGGPLPCHLDVSCFSDWELESRGVCRTSFAIGENNFACSAAMLNRVGGDLTPLLMTAFHCGVDGNSLPSFLATWFYKSDSCNGSIPNFNTLPQTPGVIVLSNLNSSDFTLVGMSKLNTQGVSFLGWSNNLQWEEGSPAVGIHHPRGSWQRIHFASQDDTFVSCIPGADDGWHTLTGPTSGLTEPGSSGSPVFDVARRVRGTLSCGSFGCNQENGQTYGRFDQAYPFIQAWMDPADPVYLDSNYGGVESGTSSQPFNSVLEGSFAVNAGSTMFLDAGTYDGPGLTIDKPVTIRSIGGTATVR